MNKNIFRFGQLAGLVLLGINLIACGSSSSSPATPVVNTLTGTAASGLATVGTVVAVDAAGVETTPVNIASDGSFSVEVTDLTPPFMLRSTATADGAALFSYADAVDIIANITPLTDLAIFIASGSSTIPGDMFANWSSTSASLNATKIVAAIATVNANLQGVMTDEGLDATTLDFFSEAFSVGTTGQDTVLDRLEISVASGITVMVDSAQTGFDVAIDTSNFDIDGTGPGGNDPGGNTFTATGNVSLTITGTASRTAIPPQTFNDLPASSVPSASGLSLIESDFNTAFGAIGSVSGVTVTLVSETATELAFNIKATITLSSPVSVVTSYDLIYTYTAN